MSRLFLVSLLIVAACGPSEPSLEEQLAQRLAELEAQERARPIADIEWEDGDSGRIDGVPFRLAGVDAPELGEIGTGPDGAFCEEEIDLGYKARAFAAGMVRDAEVIISEDYGLDADARRVLDLSVDGADMGGLGVSTGYYRLWPHEDGVPVEPKPIWCSD